MGLDVIPSTVQRLFNVARLAALLEVQNRLKPLGPILLIDYPEDLHGGKVKGIGGAFDVTAKRGIEQESLLAVN
jgi:hypothetical protein